MVLPKFPRFLIFFIVAVVFVIPLLASAQVSAEVEGLILPTTDIRIIVANIIRVALGFLGLIAVILIIYGGFLYMTAAGDEERITTAKKVITNAVIGLAIILSALAIVQFVIRALTRDVIAPPIPPHAAAPRVGGGALGSGIIESHYPMRGAMDVARNTRIVITFKQPIDPGSLANTTVLDDEGQPKFFDASDDDGVVRRTPVVGLTLKTDAIQIIKTADITDSVRESDAARYLGSLDEDADEIDVLVSFTNDLRTFVFTPVERSNHSARVFFGSATENTGYTVYLCGTASSRANNCAEGGLRLLSSGASAFQGYFNDYQWSFEVGTFLDLTPPKIRSVIPFPDNLQDGVEVQDRPDQPRNVMLQVNFNEAILPTVASGSTMVTEGGTRPTLGPGISPGTYQIMQVAANSEFVAGGWEIGNQYRTSEFISRDLCGRNSCGEDVFCLPEDAEVEVQVRAATLSDAGGPASKGIFDGIEDIAGNSFDGNSDGTAQGPGDLGVTTFFDRNQPSETAAQGDNARWGFFTSNTILLGSAIIESTAPETTLGTATAGAAMAAPVEMNFSRAMAMMTLNSRALNLSGTDAITGGIWDSWWTVEGENFSDAVAPDYGWGNARILHGGLWEETNYISAATSGVRDLYQNCFYPGAGAGIVTGDTTTSCLATTALPYCCNGQACNPDDPATASICDACGF